MKDLVDDTFILPEDVITALKDMDAVEPSKKHGGEAIVKRARVQEWAEANKLANADVVQKGLFVQGD